MTLTSDNLNYQPLSGEASTTFESLDGTAIEAKINKVHRSHGSVLLVHGFGVDLHEEGTFDHLATRLIETPIAYLRFSFRGHGKSGGTQEEMTIAGERLDLKCAYANLAKHLDPPYAILAASFGAVPTLVELAELKPVPVGIVLWNPVLDVGSVFINPVTDWGRQNFGKQAFETSSVQGYSLVEESFRAGHALLNEMRLYTENLGLKYLSRVKTVIFHGNNDTYVPIESSRAASALSNVTLVEVPNSDHGFPEPNDEERVVVDSVTYLQSFFEAVRK